MALIRLLRPHQWTKNLLVFAAILFTAQLGNRAALLGAFTAFCGMCLLSSAVYIANDLRDRKEDAAHPRKRLRPIASGAVLPSVAAILAVTCLAGGGTLLYSLGAKSAVLAGIYLLLQVAYNLGIRSVPVADVFVISSGFVIRASLGATAIQVQISGWLLLCTGALALMLGFGKRRGEWLQEHSKAASRPSLLTYSRSALDALLTMSGTGAALCYGVYALESPTAMRYSGLILTTPFVFYGIARYVFVAFANGDTSEPDVLLFRDPHVLFAIFGFLATAVLAVSGYGVAFLEGGNSL